MIQRARLPYTVIDVGCWFQVFVPKVPSGKSDKAHSAYIDHRIVGDGNQEFALTDMADIGTYVAQIISDPRTLNKCIFVYTEVMSMNEIWDVMTAASGETPPKAYVTRQIRVQFPIITELLLQLICTSYPRRNSMRSSRRVGRD